MEGSPGGISPPSYKEVVANKGKKPPEKVSEMVEDERSNMEKEK